MEISRKFCRICLTESEFNVSINGSFCRRTNMVDKILVCLKLVIEQTDTLGTICYKCAENIERFYDFFTSVKKAQTKLVLPRPNAEPPRRVTSYVREQVFEAAEHTFSFLEIPEEKKIKPFSPYFSYFSSPAMIKPKEHIWKTPRTPEKQECRKNQAKRQCKPTKPRQQSQDLFESQSQNAEEPQPSSVDWQLTPDDNILKRIRDKCFGRSDF